MLKLRDLLRVIPEAQEMCIIYLDFTVSGTMEALECMMCDDIRKLIVINIEADDGTLRVWLEEEDRHA